MFKILNLFKSLDQNSQQCTEFIENVLSISSDLPLTTDEANTLLNIIIGIINSRLNQSVTRHEGLKYLSKLLPLCSKEILTKYGSLWLAKATQHLENSNDLFKDNVDLTCKILSQLVITCKDIPELQKQISMQSVKQLIVFISNMERDKRTGGVFFLMATLLSHYREACERLQLTIRKLIIPLIDSKHKNLVQAGANCFALLTNATERSFKSSMSFPDYTCLIYQQALICNDLHVILDELFSGVLELDTVDIWGSLGLPSLSQEDVLEYYHNVERRFQNLCVYLSTTLRGCDGKNSVSCKPIMRLVCRGLAVAPDNFTNDTTYKKEILYLILPNIQMSLLNILNAFIKSFRGELVPLALTILQLYRQTLKWSGKVNETKEITMSGVKPFKRLRIEVYKSLALWMNCLGSLSGVDMISEDILPFIVRDIIPEKERVLLAKHNTSNMSKKALKKFKDSHYEKSAALVSVSKVEKNSLMNCELCMEALIALQKIFYGSGVSLAPIIYRSLHKVIVPILLDVYLEKDYQSFYSKNSECRLNLLRLLRTIQMNSNSLTSPPTQYSIEIFQLAINDSHEGIVEEARVALAELEKIVHPSAGTLDYSPSPSLLQTQHDARQDVEAVVLEAHSTKTDTVDRIRNIVKKFSNSQNNSVVFPTDEFSQNQGEFNVKNKCKQGVTKGGIKGIKRDRNGTDDVELIRDEMEDNDIEVIENEEEPKRKQSKIQIVEDICIPPARGKGGALGAQMNQNPLRTLSIEEIPQDMPERYSQNSYDSNRGENAYFTIKDAQRVLSANSSTSSDQPIEIINEISLSKEIDIIENESKSGNKDDGSDDEILLSTFCDQIKD